MFPRNRVPIGSHSLVLELIKSRGKREREYGSHERGLVGDCVGFCLKRYDLSKEIQA